MKQLTFGVDISLWQTDYAKGPKRFFDPFVAKGKGVQFAFIKASERLGKDPAVDTFARTFAGAGVPHGFYHFARPDVSYRDQVDFFLKVIEPYQGNLPPVLDLEAPNMGLEFTKAFLGRLAEKTKKLPILYTGAGYWDSFRGSEAATWALEYPLWIASYPLAMESFPQYGIPLFIYDTTTFPTLPRLWRTNNKPWAIWQYSRTGDGEFYGGNYDPIKQNQVGLDLNAFNGSLDEFYQFFDLGHFGEAPDKPSSVRVIARQTDGNPGWLFFRDSPEFYEGEVLAAGHGTVLELIDPEPQNGLWHVRTPRGREGFVSAGKEFTEAL